MEKVKSIDEFKVDGQKEYCLELLGGLMSYKNIDYYDDKFHILNLIDWSEDTFTEDELHSSIIGEAIEKGSFYKL